MERVGKTERVEDMQLGGAGRRGPVHELGFRVQLGCKRNVAILYSVGRRPDGETKDKHKTTPWKSVCEEKRPGRIRRAITPTAALTGHGVRSLVV